MYSKFAIFKLFRVAAVDGNTLRLKPASYAELGRPFGGPLGGIWKFGDGAVLQAGEQVMFKSFFTHSGERGIAFV